MTKGLCVAGVSVADHATALEMVQFLCKLCAAPAFRAIACSVAVAPCSGFFQVKSLMAPCASNKLCSCISGKPVQSCAVALRMGETLLNMARVGTEPFQNSSGRCLGEMVLH